MKTYSLSNIHLSLLSLVLIVSTAKAQETPLESDQLLKAQIELTTEKMKSLLQVINAEREDQNNLHSDYLDKTKTLSAQLGSIQGELEKFLTTELRPAFTEEIMNYNSLLNTVIYRPEQVAPSKKIILEKLKHKIEGFTKKYHEALERIYFIFGELPFSVKTRAGLADIVTFNGKKYRADFNDDVNSVFRNYIIDFLLEGCRSFTCVTFSAANYLTILQAITEYDANYNIVLGDKTTLVIPRLNKDTSQLRQILLSQDYPTSVTELPFDCRQ